MVINQLLDQQSLYDRTTQEDEVEEIVEEGDTSGEATIFLWD
jgi:hypothetical protein